MPEQLVAWNLVEAKLEHLAEARPAQLLKLYQEGSLPRFLLDEQKRFMQTSLRLQKEQGLDRMAAQEQAMAQMCDPAEVELGSRPLGSKLFQQIKAETIGKLQKMNNLKLHGTPVITA